MKKTKIETYFRGVIESGEGYELGEVCGELWAIQKRPRGRFRVVHVNSGHNVGSELMNEAGKPVRSVKDAERYARELIVTTYQRIGADAFYEAIAKGNAKMNEARAKARAA